MADDAESGRLRRARKFISNTSKRLEPNQKSVWVKAIQRTKFEGLKNALKPNTHAVERVAWLTFVSFSIWHASVLITDSVNKFNDNSMLYVFYGRIDIKDVLFPGVTVCPLHLFLRSIWDKIFLTFKDVMTLDEYTDEKGEKWDPDEGVKLLHMLLHICKPGKSFSTIFNSETDDNSDQLNSYIEWFKKYNITLEDDPTDESYTRKILPLIKQGLVDCSKMILAVLFENSKVVKEVWVATQTDMGICCSFNKIPDEVLRKDKGLMALLIAQGLTYDPLRNETMKLWGDFIIDNHQFIRDAKPNFGTTTKTNMENAPTVLSESENQIPRRQRVAGQENGLSFLLVQPVNPADKTCKVYDGVGYKIHIHSPFEEPNVKSAGIFVPPNFEVLIELSAEVTFPDKKLNQDMDADYLKCHFQSKELLEFYTQYTEGNCRKDCVAKLIRENCECLLLSMTTGGNKTICGPEKFSCIQKVLDAVKAYGFMEMCKDYTTCYQGCTDISYGVKVSYAPLSEAKFNFPGWMNFSAPHGSNIIHVFFGSQTITARKRQEQYDTGEKIGIIGGILGLTNAMSYSHAIHALAGLYLALSGFFEWLGLTKGCANKKETKSKKRRKRRSRRRNDNPVVVPAPRTVTRVNPQTGVRPSNPQTRVFILQRGLQRNRPNDAGPRQISHL